jgi:hypothetical protein
LYFCNYLPFEQDLGLYLNKLESLSPKDDLYQVWLKFAQWFWRFSFLIQCFFTLSLLSPFREGRSPSFEHTWIPSPKNDLYQVWLKLVQWFWWRSRKCKNLQTDRQQDGRQTMGYQNSSLELSAQVSYKWEKFNMYIFEKCSSISKKPHGHLHCVCNRWWSERN